MEQARKGTYTLVRKHRTRERSKTVNEMDESSTHKLESRSACKVEDRPRVNKKRRGK